MFPVEVFRTTLSKWIEILREHRIRFHLTGGLTGTAYGEPRMTQDIDIVIDPIRSRETVDSLVKSIERSDFLFNEGSLRHAISVGGLFQLLDKEECLKLDIYPREMISGELDRSERFEVFEGEFLPVVSRIDAVASKLIWISKGSHKSRRDLRAIYRNCSPAQQVAVRNWAKSECIEALLEQVLNEVNELE